MNRTRPEDDLSRHVAEVINPVSEQELHKRKDVFVLNDIAFVIPPTSISVQKEDLSYSWKTIRSPATTKVPTGHGAIRVAVVIPFLNNSLIDFHRLRVQIRHNPFVFVENRFLRESIIPEEPGVKSMAFAVDSFNISTMSGTTDAWIVQLGMSWFNYAPYGPNFLFRSEWETNDLTEYEVDSDEPEYGHSKQSEIIRKSIGWSLPLEDGKRVPRPSITHRANNRASASFSLTGDDVSPAPTPMSILEMERLHEGFEWDLLPKVSMMKKADPIVLPYNSKIYTRFYNYLQRDSLWLNFGIDLEQEFKSAGVPVEGFFGVWDPSEENKKETWALHTGPVMAVASEEERRTAQARWRGVMASVRERMLERNGRIHFAYNIYKEIMMPPEWGKAVSDMARIRTAAAYNQANTVAYQESAKLGKGFVQDPNTQNTYMLTKSSGGSVAHLVSLAPALPAGLGSPIGTATKRLTFAELDARSGQGIAERNFAVAGSSGLKKGDTRLHEGWDVSPIRGTEPTYVYPIKPGVFSNVTRFVDLSSKKTIYFTGVDGNTAKLSTAHRNMLVLLMQDPSHAARFSKYGSALDTVKNATDVGTLNSFLTGCMRVGDFLVVRAGTNAVGMFWCNGASQGNTVSITHDDGSKSVYMHLDSFLDPAVENGRADPSTPFAIMGSTGTYATGQNGEIGTFVKYLTKETQITSGSLEVERKKLTSAKSVNPETDRLEPWSFESFPVHLHIEYREPFKVTSLAPPTPFTSNGNLCVPKDQGTPSYVLVDLKTVYANAENKSWTEFPADYQGNYLKEDLTQAINNTVQQDVNAQKLDAERLEGLSDELASLINDGWYAYGGSDATMNLYYKTVIISLRSHAPTVPEEGSAESFSFMDTIFTGASASYNAVISQIPLLGHEFPTLQFLGSNEPSYSFEFAMIDKESTMDGLSSGGVALEGMRARLQRNARVFREVPNSWASLCDTFLTRFMGTYRTSDDAVDTDTEQDAPEFLEIKKRTVIDRTEIANVEGNPGLSYMSLELTETSDFDAEKLTNMSSQFEDVQTAREQVLKRIIDTTFAQKDVLALALAQAANASVFDVTSPDYGTFEAVPLPPALAGGDALSLKLPVNTEDSKLAAAIAWIVANEPENRLFSATADPDGNVYYFVNAEQLGIEVLKEAAPDPYEDWTSDYSTGQRPNVSPAKFGIQRIIDTYGTAGLAEGYKRAFDYYALLNELNRKASLTLSEDPSRVDGNFKDGGLTISEAREKLYRQPVVPSMWNAFLSFQTSLAARVVGASMSMEHVPYLAKNPLLRGDAIETLTTNKNWPSFLPLPERDQEVVDELTRDAAGIVTDMSYDMERAWDRVGAITTVPFEGMADLLLGTLLGASYRSVSDSIDNKELVPQQGLNGTVLLDDFYLTAHEEMYHAVTSLYFRKMLWSSTGLIDLGKSYVADMNIGVVDALLADKKTGYSPIDSNMESFQKVMSSTGYWSPFAPFQASDLELLGVPAILKMVPSLNFYPAQPEDYKLNESTDEIEQILNDRNAKSGLNLSSVDLALNVFGLLSGKSLKDAMDDLFPNVKGISRWGSSMEFDITRTAEEEKIEALRREYASLADVIINDYEVLKLIGLENYSGILANNQSLQGTEAYPDMLLPAHPFYGDSKDTAPDFYYWNVYDDGDALAKEHYERIADAMAFEVGEAYESMRKLQEGENLKMDHPYIKYNSAAMAEVERTVYFSAEGTDGKFNSDKNKGATAIPFYNEMTPETKVFQEQIESSDPELFNAKITLPQLIRTNVFSSAGESFTDNPSPITEEDIEKLEEKTKAVDKLFGSRQGYLDSLAPKGPDGKPVIETTTAGLETVGHSWSKESLISLSRDSTKDIFSRKLTMARAFPTFKLFFVEEDETENGLLSLDDFYSYGGVKEFTFVTTKESPADMAVITLQNVSGILDGSKRGAIADLDYFDKRIEKNLGKDRSSLATDALTEGTNYEQPFGSVVLRPGLNVQLRAGYSNDPRNLEVLLSGRIIDLSWNKNNDLAEIVVQSFGTELIQERKGMDPSAENKDVHHTTHHLLGHLMLSPELVHFGRWEVGQLFQNNEQKDARLDFTNYSREGLSGKFKFTNRVGSFMANNTGIMLFLSATLMAIQLMPAGRALTKGAAVVGGANAARGPFATMLIKGLTKIDDMVGASKVARGIGSAIETGASKTGRFTRLFTSTSKKHRAEQAAKRALDDHFRKAGVGSKEIVDFADDAQRLAAKGGITRDLLVPMIRLIRETGSPEAQRMAAKVLANWRQGASSAKTVDELTDLAESARGSLQTIYASLKVLNAPGISVTEVAKAVWGNKLGFLGRGIVGGLKLLTVQSSLLVGGYATALGLDAIANTQVVRDFNERYLRYLGRFFEATKVSFFVSPQDDNLYCPHPKDYMKLERTSFFRGLAASVTRAAVGMIDDSWGMTAASYVAGKSLFDKRADPRAYQYVIDNATIWEVFQEMSLRHPGWVYAARPYGQAFRYTMFFGVPTQRYWSKPASDRFIKRMNLLDNVLRDNYVSMVEAKELYGDRIHNYSVDEWLAINSNGKDPEVLLQNEYRGMAMKEYLRGMEVRFEPFRKHHHFSSWTDIIWNGLMSSENACANAVNVFYYDTDVAVPEAIGNQQVKAHSFLPEHMVRMHELPKYRNCRQETVARRYAMGSLLQEMKKMYRGEILLMGSPRIRPWDVGILADSYNDMFGPIEIEQVVHTFSFETGFITEIKPAAITIANEISSWPIIEAAKLASLAMEDVYATCNESYETFPSISTEDKKTLNDILGHLNISARDTDIIKERLMSLDKNNKTLSDIIGNDDELISELTQADAEISATLDNLRPAFLVGGTLLTAGTLFAGTLGGGLLWKHSKVLSLLGFASGMTGAVATGAGMYEVATMKAPSMRTLLGGSVLLMQCMREQSIMLVPLVKSGRPIVSGLSLKDPTLVWKHFKGQLVREINDTFEGAQDLTNLFDQYSTGAWEKINQAAEIASNPSRIQR